MIFVDNLVTDEASAKVVLTCEGSKFKLAHKRYPGEFVFDSAALEFAPDIAYLSHSYRDGYFLSWASEIAESRSGAAAAMVRHALLDEKPQRAFHLADFWVGENGVAAHICGDCFVKDAGGHEVINVEDHRSAMGLFAERIPEAAEFIKRMRAKQKLIRRVNELNSLAMLEAQLDLVTKLVLAHHPDSKLQGVLEGVMTTDIHNEEKLLATIKNQKSYLRALQDEYFSNKGAAVSSDPSN